MQMKLQLLLSQMDFERQNQSSVIDIEMHALFGSTKLKNQCKRRAGI